MQTPQGGLRMRAAVSRVGVLCYRTSDGREVRELVPPEELTRADSLATLAGATITDLHPAGGKVTTENFKQLAVGHVHDEAALEDKLLVTTISVNDATEVALILADERRDVSAGYECDLDETPGTFEGEDYDRVQRNRRYNHIGIGPEGWGRAGSDVGLRLDGAAYQVRADVPARSTDDVKTIKFKGKVYRTDSDEDMKALQADAEAAMTEVQKKDADNAALVEQLAALQKQLTDALTSAATLSAQVQAMQATQAASTPGATDDGAEGDMPSDEVLDAALARREALRADAATVLGKDFDFKGKKPVEIKRAVVAKVLPTVKLDSVTADALDGMFRGAVAGARASTTRNDSLAAANAAAHGVTPGGAVRNDEDEDLAESLRARLAKKTSTTGKA